MTEDFNYITSRGLPGGPNQEITYVTGVVSVEGYRYDSPDKNNSVNLIESGNISMSENDGSPLRKGPLLGIDNLGNKEIMTPGTNYSFPGDQVLEIPMAKGGGSVSWNWKGKSYSGTLIPSMENEKNRYARTKNGKIKTLPKGQDGGGLYDYDSLRDVERDVNKWLGYSMGKINNMGQILSEDQMKKFQDFDRNIENQVATIYQEYRDKDVPYGSKDWKPFEMDPRVIALRKEQADWNAANPIYQETIDIINEGMDPLRHSSSSAKTSKALQQKVRDVPYIGGVLDFFGVDNAAGFIGSNLAGIGHEAVTIGKDKRPWSIKGKESLQDIYNNYVGSLVGNQNLNEKDTLNRLVEKYKSGVFADGTVPTPKPTQRDGGSIEDVSKTYMNYINGKDESEYAKNVYDKLNRMYYQDAKKLGMGVANYIATNVITNS